MLASCYALGRFAHRSLLRSGASATLQDAASLLQFQNASVGVMQAAAIGSGRVLGAGVHHCLATQWGHPRAHPLSLEARCTLP